jgi:CHAT domain-containing protein
MSKAEALRQAQIALITGNFSAVGGQPGRTAGASSLTATLTSRPIRLNQPFYWAPFILIGNGL